MSEQGFWIFDRVDTPQQFDVVRLFQLVIVELGLQTDPVWTVVRADGYGVGVRELDIKLVSAGEVAVDNAMLMRMATGNVEWFYNLWVRVPSRNVRLGIHDSSAMFVVGPEHLVSNLAAHFREVIAMENVISDVGFWREE